MKLIHLLGFVKPACLPYDEWDEAYSGETFVVVGWGKTIVQGTKALLIILHTISNELKSTP